MKVIQNTYPEHPGIAHANKGDDVYWECHKTMELIHKGITTHVFNDRR